ncbi:hypothetical protein HG530_011951 [Fusarium avenaceum]|nr:hypothetical protein HG530_011951 [Fusarium avenaceum]
MLALSLGIIFGRTIERRMSRAQEFTDVACQKLHLLGDTPERVDMHRILGSLLNDVAHDIGGDLNGSTPRRVPSRAGMQRGAMYPRAAVKFVLVHIDCLAMVPRTTEAPGRSIIAGVCAHEYMEKEEKVGCSSCVLLSRGGKRARSASTRWQPVQDSALIGQAQLWGR